MKALGRHIIAELSQCNPDALRSLTKVKRSMVEAAKRANAEIREIKFHRFSPEGVSGVIIIAESHLAIHTWPENEYAAFDIYTCGDTTNPEKAYQYLIEVFEAKKVVITTIERGIEAPTEAYVHRFNPTETIESAPLPSAMSQAV